MTITWYGKTCILLESGSGRLVINPPSRESRLKSPRDPADLILFSESPPPKADWQHLLSKESVVIDSPGEWDLKGFFVFSFSGIFMIETEDKSLVHIAQRGDGPLSEADLERMGAVDILLISLGGKTEEALKIVNQLEPHVVIPLDYAAKAPADFLKEMGAGGVEPQAKLVIKPKTVFPEEEMQVVPLRL